jgi:hypothetical protein
MVKQQNGTEIFARVHCFKERGDAVVYRLVRRTTVKMRDPVREPSDIWKICLKSRTKAIRLVTVTKVLAQKIPADGTGYNSSWDTQGYLDCDFMRITKCS